MSPETNQPHSHKNRCEMAASLLCLAILACAAAIRIRGALNDLTLDEILSLNDVSRISSPAEIFTRLHVDNNHYLNSFWLFLAGAHGNWPWYRLPAVLAGVGSVVMAGLIGRGRSAANAWIAMLLVGFSYVEVLYSDQARGYSCVVFFSFLCWYLLGIYLKDGKLHIAALFWLGAILGFLSHLNFVAFFCATVPWAAWRLFRLRLSPGRIAGSLLLCYAVPTLVLIGLYLVDIRHMVILGGSTTTLLKAFPTSLAWVLPPAAHVLHAKVMFIVVAGGLAAGSWMLWREKSDALIFFAGVIVVFPILLVVARGATVLYVRYFIVGISFALLLLSMALASLYSRGPGGRVLCLAILAAYCIVNGRCLLVLSRVGQGNYSGAIRFIWDQTSGPLAIVGGDRDFAVGNMVKFYSSEMPAARSILFYRGGSWPAGGPEWMICERESYEPPFALGKSLSDGAGNRYLLVKTFPAAPLSAQHWFIYRNKSEMPGPAETPPQP